MKPPRPDTRTHAFAGDADSYMRIDPSPATSDRNVVRGMAPRNPEDNEQGMRKGGKVKATGKVKVHRGEHVIRASSAQKYGENKLAAVNRGTAKIIMKDKRR